MRPEPAAPPRRPTATASGRCSPRPGSSPRSTASSRRGTPHAGETVEVAARIVTIADLNRVRIEAEVDEYDTGRVALGADVLITSEGFPGESWRGRVEEIPDSVVARRIRPEDPGRPIDARVLPVKIAFAEPTPLKLGQRVEVEILAEESR